MKQLRNIALIAAFGWLAFASIADAQPVTISPFTVASDGARQFSFQAQATNYYVLYRGNNVTNITTPVRVGMGTASTALLEDRTILLNASFYRVATIPTNAPLDLDADGINDVAEMFAGSDPLTALSLVINEVDYDNIGTDTTEFVEIFNPTAQSVSLTNLVLVLINGGSNQEYFPRVPLTGTLAAGQYLVVGSPSVISTLPGSVLTFPLPSSNAIQNGAPDGVILFNPINNGILDAFSYEGPITAAIITGVPTTFNLVEGIALNATVVDSNAINGSLSRLPNGTDTNNADTDWKFTTTSTPGAANVP